MELQGDARQPAEMKIAVGDTVLYEEDKLLVFYVVFEIDNEGIAHVKALLDFTNQLALGRMPLRFTVHTSHLRPAYTTFFGPVIIPSDEIGGPFMRLSLCTGAVVDHYWPHGIVGTCRYCSFKRRRVNMLAHIQSEACQARRRHRELLAEGWRPVWKTHLNLLKRLGAPHVLASTDGTGDLIDYGTGVINRRTRLWTPAWVAAIVMETVPAWDATFFGSRRRQWSTRPRMSRRLQAECERRGT